MSACLFFPIPLLRVYLITVVSLEPLREHRIQGVVDGKIVVPPRKRRAVVTLAPTSEVVTTTEICDEMCWQDGKQRTGFTFGPAPVEWAEFAPMGGRLSTTFWTVRKKGVFRGNTGYSAHLGNTAGSRPVSTPPLDFLP